jgi:hypothetical protein
MTVVRDAAGLVSRVVGLPHVQPARGRLEILGLDLSFWNLGGPPPFSSG